MLNGAPFFYDFDAPENVDVQTTGTTWEDTIRSYILNIGTSEVRINTTREDHGWLLHALTKFNQVANLRPGWDSYNADPVDQRTLEHALQVYVSLMNNHTLLPLINATVDGGVSLAWHKGEEGLEVEIDAPFKVSGFYYNDDAPKDEWEDDVGLELEILDQFLDQMSA